MCIRCFPCPSFGQGADYRVPAFTGPNCQWGKWVGREPVLTLPGWVETRGREPQGEDAPYPGALPAPRCPAELGVVIEGLLVPSPTPPKVYRPTVSLCRCQADTRCPRRVIVLVRVSTFTSLFPWMFGYTPAAAPDLTVQSRETQSGMHSPSCSQVASQGWVPQV